MTARDVISLIGYSGTGKSNLARLVAAALLVSLVAIACAGGAKDKPQTSGRIAFLSERDGNGEIYVMNADGSGLTRLTNNPASDLSPDWSPDSKRIAFTSTRDGNFEIYVMNADGSAQTPLTNNVADDFAPAWSPKP